jgi:hypothetical protein
VGKGAERAVPTRHKETMSMDQKDPFWLAPPHHVAVVEQWLHDEVVRTFDRVASEQEKLIPAEQIFSGLESRYRTRKAQRHV